MIGTLTVDGVTVEKWSAPSAPGIGRFFAVIRQPDGVKRMGWEIGVGVPFRVDDDIAGWVRGMMPRVAASH